MELRVELLPHLLWEAKLAQLSEHLLEEVDLWLLEFALCKFEKKRFCLAEIFASCLTQQDC